MPLKRESSQNTRTLEGFYEDLAASSDDVSRSIGLQMLRLLPMLREACGNRAVWGLTSLTHLWLLAVDDWRSRWLVRITAFPGNGFRVSFRMPDADAPWPDAMVDGEARDERHACELTLIAMRESGGWAP